MRLRGVLPAVISVVVLCSFAESRKDLVREDVLPASEGVTATEEDVSVTAELAEPYENALHQAIPFGLRSYYLSPWRAYMDTWPASRFLEVLGVGFSHVEPEAADAAAQVLAEAGMRSVRIEIGWGYIRYDDPSAFQDHPAKKLTQTLQACRKHGLRPILLLNGHHGRPCPTAEFEVALTADAPEGAREVVFDRIDNIRPGYTGFDNLTEFLAAFPMITDADGQSGRCRLSAPLPRELKAGKVKLITLRYQPFAGAVFENGRQNVAARETLNGWMQFVAATCSFAKRVLGTEGAGDAGFDLEVWNELSFGSNFLDLNRYHEPQLKFTEPVKYSAHGRTAEGSEIILPMTVDYISDPANRCPGVGVISGFSNQRPWDSGSQMWPGQAGISRHYYTHVRPFGDFSGAGGLLSPETEDNPNSGPVDALGNIEGKPDGKDWHTVLPGTFFIPTLAVSMPEMWHFGYRTEFMTRDVQPFPSTPKNPSPISFADHHRYSHPGTGRPAQVWMTEFNAWREPWMNRVQEQAGCDKGDARLIALAHAVGAKALLRSFVFHSHKGVHTITVYSSRGDDLMFGVFPTAFFETLKEEKYELTDKVRAESGPQLQVVGRVARLMKTGARMETARPLFVEQLIEHDPQRVFKGDGTQGRPDRFHRDDFACLPYQLAADKFAVGYYVVTRNIVKDRDESRDLLDPARYDMLAQTFDLTLKNIRGAGAEVSAWDPMTDRAVPVKVLKAEGTSLTIRLAVVDYPRFLIIDESSPGPLVLDAGVVPTDDGGAELTFGCNVKAGGTVTWGPLPTRARSSSGPPEQLTEKQSRTVEVCPGSTIRLKIPELGVNDGVQVVLESDGLVARWPRWKQDVKGVARFDKPEPYSMADRPGP